MSGVTLASCAIRVLAMRNANTDIGREIFIIVRLRCTYARCGSVFGTGFVSVQPVLEARLAESGVIVRNQCPLAHRDPVVAPARVGDYLAWILARSQVPSDEFVQAKLFGAPYFNGAIHR